MADKETRGAYKELQGVLESIPSEGSWFYDKGFIEHGNRVINRVGSICSEIEDVSEYQLRSDSLSDGRVIVQSISTRQKLKSLLGRIEGLYGLSAIIPPSGNTFIQNQSQSQYLSVMLDVQERILKEIPKHEAGTKERTFLEKLKETLPTLNGVMDVLSHALKIGAQLGLNATTIHQLLGL